MLSLQSIFDFISALELSLYSHFFFFKVHQFAIVIHPIQFNLIVSLSKVIYECQKCWWYFYCFDYLLKSSIVIYIYLGREIFQQFEHNFHLFSLKIFIFMYRQIDILFICICFYDIIQNTLAQSPIKCVNKIS